MDSLVEGYEAAVAIALQTLIVSWRGGAIRKEKIGQANPNVKQLLLRNAIATFPRPLRHETSFADPGIEDTPDTNHESPVKHGRRMMPESSPAADTSSRRRASVAVAGSIASLGILILWSSQYPSAWNWGFHYFAFYDWPFKLVVFAAMVLLMMPAVQDSILKSMERARHAVTARGVPARVALGLLLFGGLLGIFSLFRERTFFLGDGFLNLRVLQDDQNAALNTLSIFRREPLTGVFYVQLRRVCAAFGSSNPAEDAYRWLSMISGIGCVLIAWVISRNCSPHRVERFLTTLLIVGSGVSQLFFGYIENYAPTCFALLLFIAIALAYAGGRVSIVWPVFAFGAMLAFNLGTVAFVPVALLLMYESSRRKELLLGIFSVAVSACLFVLLLYFSGSLPIIVHAEMNYAGQHFLPWTAQIDGIQAYGVTDSHHVVDIANLFLLCQASTIVLLIIAFRQVPLKQSFQDRRTRLLGLVTLCGAVFIGLVNPELGMSRDWDALAPFTLGVPVTACLLWGEATKDIVRRRRGLVATTIVSLILTGTWVGVNASEQRSLSRINILPDQHFWSRTARNGLNENMAIYYRSHDDFVKSREYYQRYLSLDSSDSRIWRSLLLDIEESGDTSSAKNLYTSIVAKGMGYEEALNKLSGLLVRHKRYQDALRFLSFADSLSPSVPSIPYRIGIIVRMAGSDYKTSLDYYLEAIRRDSTFDPAYVNAAWCYQMMGDRARADEYSASARRLQKK